MQLVENHAAIHPKISTQQERIKEAIGTRSQEQDGFCSDKSSTDQIATLRIIIEQS